MSKWFNPYRIVGMAVMSLNTFGRVAQVNSAVEKFTGYGLGTIHPAVEIAMFLGNMAPVAASEIEYVTNECWLLNAKEVKLMNYIPVKKEVEDGDYLEIERQSSKALEEGYTQFEDWNETEAKPAGIPQWKVELENIRNQYEAKVVEIARPSYWFWKG